MPCKDVTELLEVVLNADDSLKDYRFSKRTCGQGVGMADLIIEQLRGRSMKELLDKTAQDFLAEFPIPDPVEEFLSLKHLFAIQGALEVYAGIESGTKQSAFAIAGVEYGEDETLINGRISVDILTEKIKSCGGCKSCGNTEGKAVAPRRRAKVAAK